MSGVESKRIFLEGHNPGSYGAFRCYECSTLNFFTLGNLHVSCWSCKEKQVLNMAFGEQEGIDISKIPINYDAKPPKEQEREENYYDILNVGQNATACEIKKSYRDLVRIYHPDKNVDDSSSSERFKVIHQAYKVLSNETTRLYYDYNRLNDKEKGGGNEIVDIGELFTNLFGGNGFVPIIGEISLSRILEDVLVEDVKNKKEKTDVSSTKSKSKKSSEDIFTKEKQEQSQKNKEKRVEELLQNLINKTSTFIEGILSEGEFRDLIKKEAKELSLASYGIQLLHCIGYVYETRANKYLKKDLWLGIPSLISSVKEKYHIISSVITTVRTLNEMSKNYNMNSDSADPEMVKKAEEKIKNALWKASCIDIESTLRDVTDRFLSGSTVTEFEVKNYPRSYGSNSCSDVATGSPRSTAETNIVKKVLQKRSLSLKIIGEIYRSV